MTNAEDGARDYLAFINNQYGGGSWARGKDRDDTIKRAALIFRSDWKHLFVIPETIRVAVGEVTGHDEVIFGDHIGIKDAKTNEDLSERVEVVEFKYPKKTRR
jgi:hypothetical protein